MATYVGLFLPVHFELSHFVFKFLCAAATTQKIDTAGINRQKKNVAQKEKRKCLVSLFI